MDLSTLVMIVVIGWTVVGLILVAAIWSRAPWKAVLAWLGIALLPLGVWLVGLWRAAIDGWNTLAAWWAGLVFDIPAIIGLSVLGLAALLLVLSRLVPNRPRTRKTKPTPSVTSSRPSTPSGGIGLGIGDSSPAYRQPPTQSERTLTLPENRNP